jgi:hypothetical protein
MAEPSTRRRDAAVWAAAVAVLGAFCAARWLVAAHREISRFVVAGSAYVSRAGAPRFLHVFAHSRGYDGQFYWRLAADPFQLHLAANLGVRLDSAYRLNRILYPTLAWLVAAGRVPEVAWAMVAVNLAAILALVALALRAARRRGLDARWALVALAVPGLVGSLSRDLTEALAAVLGVAGVIAYRESRGALAGACLAGAVLTRETMVVVVVLYALNALVAIARRRRGLGRVDLAWAVPLVALALWQLVVHLDVGVTPLLSSAGSGDLGVPLWGLVHSVPGWFSPHSTHQLARGGLYVLQSVGAAWLLLQAWRNRRAVAVIERVVLGVFVALWLCESAQGWAAPFDARYGAFPMALAWLQLLEGGDRSRLTRAIVVLGPVVVLTALWRVAVI